MTLDQISGSRSVSSRLLAVLDAFGPAESELTLTEIARRSGQPLPTTHRFVRELVRWGGLERCPGGGYRIGARLWELASRAPRTEGLRQAATPLLHGLTARAGRTVRLAISDGTDALCVEVVSRDGAPGTDTGPGSRLPLHATAVGKVLLAHGEDELLRSVLQSSPRRYTAYTLPPGLLLRAVARIRAGEVAQAREEYRLGEFELAVPVCQPDGAVAALGMLCGLREADRVQAAALLRSAATELSRTLAERGHRTALTGVVSAR